LEDIRQSYRSIEESKILDEATRPKEVRGHEPGEPLEMPATIHVSAAAAAPAAGAAPGAPGTDAVAVDATKPEEPAVGALPRRGRPNLNVTPAPRGVNVEK
jgi:hypothetical protein